MLNKKALSAAPSVEKDSNFKQTVLLLHGDGTNGAQNNTFTDSSTNAFTITRNGNTTQGTFSPFSVAAGEWSNYFDGTGDDLTVASNAALQLASESNWTVEFWGYFVSTPDDFDVVLGKGTTSGNYEYFFEAFSDRTIDILYSADGTTTWTGQHQLTGDLGLNQWFHFAAVRNGATLKSYVNGVEYFSGSSFNIYAGTGVLNIGGYSGAAGQDPNMYLSNVRIVKGTAVYTSNFTPPTAPLTAITNTSLLTCQSNRFVDNSTNAFAITVNGNPSVQPFSPFAPSAAYSASTNGGSGYFDGTGDYLTAPDNAALDLSGDFTVECWVYVPNVSGEKCVFHNHTSDGNGIAFIVNGAAVRLLSGTGGSWSVILDSSTSITAKSWNHIAGTRSSNTYTVWVNGASGGTATSSTTPSYSGGAQIGRFTSGSPNAFLDYMSSLRVVKGTAVYTGTFTPPTAPLTAITNTSLLLNFTNAGIIDNTGKNNLETVGNAQIDTGTKKFGTGSLEFDGAGDYLFGANTPNTSFGSGDFTIEAWIYRSSTDSSQAIFQKGRVADGNFECAVYLVNTGDKVEVYYSTAGNTSTTVLTSSATVSLSTWTHIAVTRSGSTWRLFIDGTLDSSATASVTLYTGTGTISVGANPAGASTYTGFIDDLRITKGVARYTATFTPPAKAFADQ